MSLICGRHATWSGSPVGRVLALPATTFEAAWSALRITLDRSGRTSKIKPDDAGHFT